MLTCLLLIDMRRDLVDDLTGDSVNTGEPAEIKKT